MASNIEKIRDIVKPVGEFERFFQLPVEIQNEILNKLDRKSSLNLLSTSKILSEKLASSRRPKSFSQDYLIKKFVSKFNLTKNESIIQDFIIENYQLLMEDDQFSKLFRNRLTKLNIDPFKLSFYYILLSTNDYSDKHVKQVEEEIYKHDKFESPDYILHVNYFFNNLFVLTKISKQGLRDLYNILDSLPSINTNQFLKKFITRLL
jgi:hypothetical protein